MNAWETDDEWVTAVSHLPTPTDTPYRTPSRASRGSRRSSRHRKQSVSPGPSSSPPPMPAGDKSHHRNSRDFANDESIPESDMRRFTPTLHANLVSEILARRRDLEERDKTMDAFQAARRRDLEERDQVIDALQADLHDQRGVHEQYELERINAINQNKSLQRELEALKSGNSTALASLADELKAADKATADYKARLEAALKRIRSQDESEIRVQKIHDKDKVNLEDKVRKLELKAHVAEVQRNAEAVRVRALQDENASLQKIIQNGHSLDNDVEQAANDFETASVRTRSPTNSIRFSMLGGSNGYGGKTTGVSLADELNFDDYDEEDLQSDHEGRESVLSKTHMRNQSRESVISRSHRRNQSGESLMRPGSVVRGGLWAQQIMERLEGGIQEDDETPKFEYVDSGIQFSPPPSPKIQAIEIVSVIEPIEPFQPLPSLKIQAVEVVSVIEPVEYFEPATPVIVDIQDQSSNGKIEQQAELAPREWEVEANQRRKRVHASPTLFIETPSSSSMVSSAVQTSEDPLSPPRTPISPTRAPPPPPITEVVQEMISISTQTDILVPSTPPAPSPRRAPPPPSIAIPSIQLHPPNSAPATPQEPLLPQHFKDVGCQINMHVSVPTRSISMQTEEIRVDKRRMKLLPLNLQPSSISSQPPSPEPYADSRQFSPVPGNLPPRNPRRVTRSSIESEVPSSPPEMMRRSYIETRDSYPGNNDDGPLAKDQGSIRRPPRISSLFAGFENISSDDADDFADGDMSDNDYRTALSPNPATTITIGRVALRRVQTGPSSVPEGMAMSGAIRSFVAKSAMRNTISHDVDNDYVFPRVETYPTRTSSKPVRQLDKPLTLVANTKPNAFRRAALIQSGVAAHQGRARSPSLPDLPVVEPPFPIPTRASSRRPPVSSSAPSDGNRSPTYGRGGPSRGSYRANSIRKTRSAAALPRGGRAHRRSPPSLSASTEAPESPALPSTPRYMRDTGSSRYRSSHRQQPSSTTANTSYTTQTAATTTATVETSNQATSVVDAIAQTMVGEWMFKYVRRRKSFGIAESNGVDGTENSPGARHKRWVWLAPYERAVMWSSKQPTSGSALMGKAGRKLTIQSVLDVKDDNPPPKGVPGLFNRSILILTPERALKFTATTPERHYVWLTALSFLAHSSQAVPEITHPPLPIPQTKIPNFEIPKQTNRLRRGGIKDSIRVAKGKTSITRPGLQPARPDHSAREAESFYTSRASVDTGAAEPPVVPRFTDRTSSTGPPLAHSRKRSNTGSRIPPPLSFRGFSGPASSSSHAPTSSTAEQSIGSPDVSQTQSQPSGSVAGYNGMSVSGRSSIRTSDASARPGAVVSNFFDAVGTMRMEAFISPMQSRFDDYPDEQDEMDMVGMNRRHSRERRHRRSDSYYSKKGRPSDDLYSGSKTAGEEDYFDSGYSHDPFRGF